MFHIVLVALLGLCVGVLVGLMGIGGGILMVPAFVYLLGMDQHMAQGTSLLIMLPPLGLGGLYHYWRHRQVDLSAGLLCAAGFLSGGYFGSVLAIHIPSQRLGGMFGLFMIFAAVMLWRQAKKPAVGSADV